MTQQMINTLSIEKSSSELREYAYKHWSDYPSEVINGYLEAAELADLNKARS